MIATFRSKALKAFWEHGESRRLPIENHARVRRQLLAIDAASKPEDVNVPGYRFHGLNTEPKRWSIWVTDNFRIAFAWDGGNAVDLDIEDYH
jgi:proteic killer suppression protein